MLASATTPNVKHQMALSSEFREHSVNVFCCCCCMMSGVMIEASTTLALNVIVRIFNIIT